jgi:hypothetical protein
MVDYEHIDLYWPDENSMEEVVTALRNNDEKKTHVVRLTCDFDDERMNTSQKLQEAIMDSLYSVYPLFLVSLSIFNSCDNREERERCLDFFLRHLELGTALNASYTDLSPWTLVEAQKATAAITRSDETSDLTLSGDLFAIEGTFECVLNAVIDGGTIDEFVVQTESIPDLKLGCIGRSNLANNTTLKRLNLELWEDDAFVADEGIEQIANALKSNRGLEEIIITRGMMTNAGRRLLLESLGDNTTLFKLDTRGQPVAIFANDDRNEDEEEVLRKEGGIEGRLLQSQFDRHMKLNRFWKRLKKRGNDDKNDGNSDDDNHENEKKDLGGRFISMEILPDILEILSKKPLLLYTFLREEDHTQLLGTLCDRPSHRTRRRSERLFKRRRITAPGSKF